MCPQLRISTNLFLRNLSTKTKEGGVQQMCRFSTLISITALQFALIRPLRFTIPTVSWVLLDVQSNVVRRRALASERLRRKDSCWLVFTRKKAPNHDVVYSNGRTRCKGQ